jgi:hypothetical protein
MVAGVFQTLVGWISSAVDWISRFNSTKVEEKTTTGSLGGISGDLSKYTQPKLNGSHANGLSYVPFDGYVAELHKGERVLTAQEAKSHGVTININDAMIMDDYSVDKLMSKVVGRLNALGVR